MEKIAIIGATGFVGSALLQEAIGRGIHVTAVARDTSGIPDDDRITPIKADINNVYDLADSLTSNDAVISAYNPGWEDPDIYDKTLEGYRSIITSTKKSGVKRLLIVGGAGSLFVEPGTMLMDTGSIPDKLLPGVRSLAEVYFKLLPEENQLDWVFFSPAAQLIPGESKGNYRLGNDSILLDIKGNSIISVGDYAKAMLDEAQYPQHHRERFTIGYK